jgi:hypothetical protein
MSTGSSMSGNKGASASSSTLKPAGISLAQAWGNSGNAVLLAGGQIPSSAAGPTVTAVPAPLLAAAAKASDAQDGGLLGFVSRHALPGLLVAIATAFVGFVAAGNIKVLQPKLATLSGRLQELDNWAKSASTRFARTASTRAKRVSNGV